MISLIAALLCPLWCRHRRVRCIHGDEIRAAGYRRRQCLDCGRYVRGPLPELCAVTGELHHSLT